MNDQTRIKNWLVPVLLSLLVVLCLTSMRFNSPTSDEQNHVSRGYHYLVTGNLDLNVAPPFVNALSGVPLLFHKGIILPQYDLTHRQTYINEFAEDFVWGYNDAETVINSGRLASIFLSVILGYFVFRWAREMWGMSAGLLALFLYVLDPNILAHSQLVTTDLGVACLSFVATYFLWRFLRGRRNMDLILAGVLLGLAQATKFSALLFLPIFVLIVFIEAFIIRDSLLRSASPPAEQDASGRSGGTVHCQPAVTKHPLSRQAIRRAVYFFCVVLLVLFFVAFLSMWASYRFEAAPLVTSKPSHATVDRLIHSPTLRKVVYRVVESMPVPFPTYFRGISWLQGYAQRGAPAFLMGNRSNKGWWYYFLVAFAIKTPIPTLLLFGMAVYLTVREGSEAWKREHALFVPIGAFFLATFFSFLNIGYRHILPVLPFVFVLASKAAAFLISGKRIAAVPPRSDRRMRIALALLCLWYAIASGRMFPHYLAYFNEIVGGPEHGYKYLVDSNLDWGQDLKNLKAYMDRNGLDQIYLAYFGSAHPGYYGIQALPLPEEEPDDLHTGPPRVYAISATYLQGGYLGDTQAFAWLRPYQPFAKIGYSIFLYKIPMTNGQ